MKYCFAVVFSLCLSMGLWGQKTVSLNADSTLSTFYAFNRGMKIEFFNTARDDRPRGGFIVGDSLIYMIGEKSFHMALFNLDKVKQLELQSELFSRKIINLEEQNTLLREQIGAEQKAFQQLQLLSEEKSNISQDAIDRLHTFRRKGIFYSALLGLVGGALWIREGDGVPLQIGKPLAIAAGAVYLSFNIFN